MGYEHPYCPHDTTCFKLKIKKRFNQDNHMAFFKIIISVELDILIMIKRLNLALRMNLTCLCLSIFLFHTECFFNLHVFNLLFNKCHLYNIVSCGSQSLHQEFFCVFGHSVIN